MTQTKARVWKKIIFFYTLTMLLTTAVGILTRRAPANITLVTAMMWCPAIAAFLTKRVFSESIRDLGWTWGGGRYQFWSYAAPILYTLPVYVVVWLTGLGGFYNVEFMQATAKEYGLSGLPLTGALVGYVLITMTAGFIPKTGRALGEEIGWRGFLVPELAKVTGFTSVGLISGIMWAAWHYPSILFGNYNEGTPAWYTILCFTVMVTGSGFIAAWLRLRSKSVWTAAFLHGSHNMFIQLICTPLTTNTGHTAYIIDEFGAGLAISTVIGAIIVWRKRGELEPVVHSESPQPPHAA